jgi:hypothetical protein
MEAKQVVDANLPVAVPSVRAVCLSVLISLRSDGRACAAAAQLCDSLQAVHLCTALGDLMRQVAAWATAVHALKAVRQRPNPLGNCRTDRRGAAGLCSAAEPA